MFCSLGSHCPPRRSACGLCSLSLWVCCQGPHQTGSFQKAMIAWIHSHRTEAPARESPGSTFQKACLEHPSLACPGFFSSKDSDIRRPLGPRSLPNWDQMDETVLTWASQPKTRVGHASSTHCCCCCFGGCLALDSAGFRPRHFLGLCVLACKVRRDSAS